MIHDHSAAKRVVVPRGNADDVEPLTLQTEGEDLSHIPEVLLVDGVEAVDMESRETDDGVGAHQDPNPMNVIVALDRRSGLGVAVDVTTTTMTKRVAMICQ